MLKTETLMINLPVELLMQMRDAVEAGDYRSDTEVIADALLEWSLRHRDHAEDVDALKRAWQEAEDHPGPGVPMEEVMDRLKAKYSALAAEAGGLR